MGCAGSRIEFPFEDYDWKELPKPAREAAETLGYTQDLWDTDADSPMDDLDFDELTDAQQAAARVLGYNQELWDKE